MARKPYEKRERRYIAEWAEDRFPDAIKIYNCPIGPVPESLIAEVGVVRAAKVFRPWRPKADVVLYNDEMIAVAEAEILNPRDAIGDLVVYIDLLPETPELREHMNKVRKAYLVVPWIISWVKRECDKRGIIVDIFKPDWIDEYLAELERYYTPEARRLRELKRRG